MIDATLHDTPTRHDENEDIVSIVGSTQQGTELNTQHDVLAAMAKIMAQNMQPRSPLWGLEELEKAIANNWILTTSQVEELIGVKPFGEEFERGCFLFLRTGKIGNQNGWMIEKMRGEVI